MGGLLAFKAEIYKSVQEKDLESEADQHYFKHLKSITFGVRLLELSSRQIEYIKEPLMLDSSN